MVEAARSGRRGHRPRRAVVAASLTVAIALTASACGGGSGVTEVVEEGPAPTTAAPTTTAKPTPTSAKVTPTTRPAPVADLNATLPAPVTPGDIAGQVLALVQQLGIDPAQFTLAAAQNDPIKLLEALRIDPAALGVPLVELQQLATTGDATALLAKLGLGNLNLAALQQQFEPTQLLNSLAPDVAAALNGLLAQLGQAKAAADALIANAAGAAGAAGAAAGAAASAGGTVAVAGASVSRLPGSFNLPRQEILDGLSSIAQMPLATAIGYPIDEAGTRDTISTLQEALNIVRTDQVAGLASMLQANGGSTTIPTSPADLGRALGIDVGRPDVVSAYACNPAAMFAALGMPENSSSFLAGLFTDPNGTLAPLGDVTIGEVLAQMGFNVDTFLAMTDRVSAVRDELGLNPDQVGMGLNALAPMMLLVAGGNVLSNCGGAPGAGLEPLLGLIGLALPLLARIN